MFNCNNILVLSKQNIKIDTGKKYSTADKK